MPTLDWIGKEKVVNHHLDVPYRVLERVYSYDQAGQHDADNGSENMIIHGDNLEALKALLPKYEGQIKWWHRVIDSNKKEFRINGFINHYPDFVVMFQSGRVALIEAKGNHLANDDSRRKLKLGRKWASMAGRKYRYFMVFNHEKIDAEGAYTLDDIVGVLKEL